MRGILAVSLALAAWPAIAFAQTSTPAQAPAAAQASAPAQPKTLRNARYCEVLPISLGLNGLKARVFNTIGYGDCPAALWDKLSESAVRKQFGAVTVMMNGPRYFLMDRIIPKGATAKGEMADIGGMTFESRAEVKLSLFELQEKPYSEHTINRETVYRFDAGQPTFQLKSPKGASYVMQAYAAFIDKSLTYNDLPNLGARLKLPAGWSYSVVTPTQDLLLKATGKATVIQDEMKNTYQKIIP
ncbi:hypothetical protein ABLE91_22895 [Aquabacter sp. CN5-332]|uniref:hypothetical protein n=1 Tax=Aquabacter sp. CN5-332 TaxID=3156608 RepID=UPI0032B5C3F7